VLAVWAANTLINTRRTFLRLTLIFALLLTLPLAAAPLYFNHADKLLPLWPAITAMGLALAYVLLDFVHSQYERSRIKGMFGTYLSPAIVNRMIASGEEPKLGGEQVRLTAFFSDVQSFSSFSEILTPAQLVEIMNAYLGAMTDILEADEGTLDKYIGDAIVAMFGAPIPVADHAHRGCACALRMQKRMAQLRADWAAQGDKWPKKIHAMRMRIGLNSGPATVGNMGSAKRFNYTMMGDTVNLAARCESGAKSAGVYTLVSSETMDEAKKSSARPILFRRIDRWRVKGRAAPVLMVEVVDFLDEASADTRACVRLYEQALDLYFAQKFAEAKHLFAQARQLEPLQPGRDAGVEHTASELMTERCDTMLAHPPGPGWDGVFVMTSK
jgi:adenylate cyclase